MPVGVVSLLGALIGSIVSTHRFEGTRSDLLMFGLLASCCAALGAALYYVVCAHHGHTYKALPSATELRDYRTSLEKWYVECNQSPDPAAAESEAYLEECFATAATANAEVNLKKWNFLFLANRRLIFAAVLLGLASVPYLSGKLLNDATTPQLIEFGPATREALLSNVRQARTQGAATAPSAAVTPATKATTASAQGHARGLDSTGTRATRP